MKCITLPGVSHENLSWEAHVMTQTFSILSNRLICGGRPALLTEGKDKNMYSYEY